MRRRIFQIGIVVAFLLILAVVISTQVLMRPDTGAANATLTAMAFQPSPISVLPTPQGTDQPYNTPRPTREGTILPKITQPPTGADDGSLLTLEARETQIVRTFTPVPPALTPITRPIQTTSIAINDAYGQRIGTGQILVRAPNVMQPDSEAKIRVEIELFPLSNEPTLVPPPSSTPLEAKLQATPTAIPTITGGAATSDIFEFTSVEIDGLNKDRFNLKPDLTNGVRKIIRGVRYSWQWSISPREAAKALSTDFEALIFAQRDVEPTTQRVLVTRVPFKISVPTPVSAAPLLAILAVLVLIAIGGGVGVVALRSRTSNWGTERIFISYRRADTRDMTERIRDELAQHFGSKAIFKDIGSIEYGEDYRQRLEASVKRADVVLVMIGTQYLTITDAATGERRLFQPNDFVRLEVELGLQNNKTVIPLLVDGATMPKADDLPPSIRELSFRNALPVRPDPDFHADMERLRLAIEKVLSKPNTNR